MPRFPLGCTPQSLYLPSSPMAVYKAFAIVISSSFNKGKPVLNSHLRPYMLYPYLCRTRLHLYLLQNRHTTNVLSGISPIDLQCPLLKNKVGFFSLTHKLGTNFRLQRYFSPTHTGFYTLPTFWFDSAKSFSIPVPSITKYCYRLSLVAIRRSFI